MNILKVSTGLDPVNLLDRTLGDSFRISNYDPRRPLVEQVNDADILLLREVPVPVEVIEAAPNLRLLQRYGQHLTGVNVRHAVERGIHVARVPTEVTGASRMVAEHAVFLMLAAAKRSKQAADNVSSGVVSLPKTQRLSGKTLGMIGLGQTGIELLRLLSGFDMRSMVVKRTVDRRIEQELGISFMGTMDSLEHVLSQSDYISIHLPLDDGTTDFIGEREFSMMKQGSVLINIARAPIVNRQALVKALESGRLAGAAMDVMWEEPVDRGDPLLKMPNVYVTPHIAGATEDIHEKLTAVVANNIRLVSEGKAPDYPVSPDEDS